ncbi:MAG: cytochrome c oxidase assembly protein [Actinomycetota bacterium]|nr:cytochrome c oxidase assembly protein [Actinomycetota bacterium]
MPAPSVGGLLTLWSAQPLAIAAALLLAGWYWRSVVAVRRAGRAWPARRSVLFAAGIGAGIWTTCGFPQVYASALFWVWTSQQLTLLLLVPLVVLAGGPLRLARLRSGESGWAGRILRSRPAKVLANPLVGPALVPVLSAVLFFGPLPGWAIDVAPVGWLLQLLVLAAGAMVVLPLVGVDETPSSLRVGLALAIGSFELVLDAVPGIALRLHRSLSTSYFDYRAAAPWAPGALHDQQIAGSILWCVAELIDLPFLVLVFRQWLRADARDAAEVDAVLEAERIAQVGVERSEASADDRDTPWWLSDPSMRDRWNRRD